MRCKSKKPKWLELAEGEVYLKNVMSRQAIFVAMISALTMLSAAMLAVLIIGDADEIMMPMTMILGSMSSVYVLGISKLHVTNQRLVMECKNKGAGQIRLDEIKAIQVTKKIYGGKVLIVPTKKGAGAIEISVTKPYQFAEEIQKLSAGMSDDAQQDGSIPKGVAK